MRRRTLVTILGAAGVVGIVAVLALVLASGGQREESATSSIVVSIPDNPASLAATEAQEAEAVVTLADTEDEPPEQEEVGAEPEAPQDLLIADAMRRAADDPLLHKGAHADDITAVKAFYASHNGPALWLNTAGISPKGQALLGELGRAGEWGLDPSIFRVPPADYQPAVAEDQAATEIAISLAALKYARAARGGLVDPASKNFDQTPPLRDPAAVLAEIAASQTPDTYLTDLHPKHEQFARLRQALAKAHSEEEIVRIEANMDRWRWMPEQLGASYVWLNIPEFMLHVVKDGKTVASEKIVVGKSSNPTPVLSADLTAIVFNPERNVPLSVIRRDVLPKLKQGNWFGGADTSVLDAYQITVKSRGKAVDPNSIDWNKVNLSTLTFVQAPGRTNVLGKVQFLYPNDRGVYMHDTIIRSQLARDVRADGAKEPRVANPEKLAGLLLAEDKGWSQAKVNQLTAGGKPTTVKLEKPIPVHTTYFTAVVDEEGEIKTFDDVYELDKRGTPGDEAAASPPVAGSAPPPTRKPASGSLAASTP
jgi:murein L,D-transpeptidase YcbB/YkuD